MRKGVANLQIWLFDFDHIHRRVIQHINSVSRRMVKLSVKFHLSLTVV